MTTYECNVCNDMGLVKKDVPVAHPDFGKAFPCPACTTHHDQQMERSSRVSQLNTLHPDKTLDNFEIPTDYTREEQENLNHALAHIHELLEQIINPLPPLEQKDPMPWLILKGSYGTGKTHLAAGIAHACTDAGVQTIFSTTPDLLDHLRTTYMPHAIDTYDVRLDTMRQVPVLILDDLGVENQSSWAQEKLYQLIDYRYNRPDLFTIVTTNDEINNLDGRLKSRLGDTRRVWHMTLQVPDYRLQNSTLEDIALGNLIELPYYQNMTFDTFRIKDVDSERIEEDVFFLQSYSTPNNDKVSGWVVMVGNSGVGKSHLSAACVHNWTQHTSRSKVLFTQTGALLNHLRDTFSATTKASLQSRLDAIRKIPFLVLDDFRIAPNTSDWTRDQLFQIIEHRYVRRLPTIFTLKPQDQMILHTNYEDIYTRMMDTAITNLILLRSYNHRMSDPSTNDRK